MLSREDAVKLVVKTIKPFAAAEGNVEQTEEEMADEMLGQMEDDPAAAAAFDAVMKAVWDNGFQVGQLAWKDGHA
jgi:methionine salvage enolase-phosphatase E1